MHRSKAEIHGLPQSLDEIVIWSVNFRARVTPGPHPRSAQDQGPGSGPEPQDRIIRSLYFTSKDLIFFAKGLIFSVKTLLYRDSTKIYGFMELIS